MFSQISRKMEGKNFYTDKDIHQFISDPQNFDQCRNMISDFNNNSISKDATNQIILQPTSISASFKEPVFNPTKFTSGLVRSTEIFDWKSYLSGRFKIPPKLPNGKVFTISDVKMACFYQGKINYRYKYIADCGPTSKWNVLPVKEKEANVTWPSIINNEKLKIKFEKKLKDMKKILREMVDREKKESFQAQICEFFPGFENQNANLQIEEVSAEAADADSDSDGGDFDMQIEEEDDEEQEGDLNEVSLGDALGNFDLKLN